MAGPIFLFVCCDSRNVPNHGLPPTGQKRIYHPSTGADSGDDGLNQAGWNGIRRFEVGGDGIWVKDNATGLIWQRRESSSQKFGDLFELLNWKDAFKYIEEMNSLKFAGYSDWRLPNINELQSIVNFGTRFPAINGKYFDNTESFYYWSSTSVANNSPSAWCIYFQFGDIRENEKINGAYIRAVRGMADLEGLPRTDQIMEYYPSSENAAGDDGVIQQGWDKGMRFKLCDNNTSVQDRATGLIWQRRESSSREFGGISGSMTWLPSFDYVEAMNKAAFAHHTDWRLPNIRELASIVDFGKESPAINDKYFLNTHKGAGFYWSSTTVAECSTNAWAVLFKRGETHDRNKGGSGYIRVVRGGRGWEGKD